MRQKPLEIVIFVSRNLAFQFLITVEGYIIKMLCTVVYMAVSRMSAALAFAEKDVLVGSIQYFADMSNRAYMKSNYVDKIKS